MLQPKFPALKQLYPDVTTLSPLRMIVSHTQVRVFTLEPFALEVGKAVFCSHAVPVAMRKLYTNDSCELCF